MSVHTREADADDQVEMLDRIANLFDRNVEAAMFGVVVNRHADGNYRADMVARGHINDIVVAGMYLLTRAAMTSDECGCADCRANAANLRKALHGLGTLVMDKGARH